VQVSRVWRRHPRTAAVTVILIGLTAAIVAPGLATASPPPNPTDNQLRSAQQLKQDTAALVGKLSGQVADAQSKLQQLQANSELAAQKYDYALQLLSQAQAAAKAARAATDKAQQGVVAAQRNFIGYVQATYMNGNDANTTGSLLTASDPNALLQQSTLLQYQASHQLNAIGDMQRAKVAKSNADAAARQAVANQKKATTAAANAKAAAVAAAQSAAAQTKALQANLASSQTQLQAAQLHLATLNNERAKFIAYQHAQAVLAAQRRAAAAARARAAARAAAAAAARAAAHHGQGGGSGGSSNGPAPTPSGGGWSQAKANAAVQRAKNELGIMYAWDGGSPSGPTLGVCAGDGAENDCHIVGFDCSGLTLYAWAQSISLYHYTVTQYSQAGSYHPSPGNFRPGDLLFWSSNGSVSGIHHVAIYIGGGMVIQAPQSGEVIQETPWDQVDWGYYGATRPLT
jgi:peptidoglycan DL-endopeptidase RipA